MDLIGNIDWSAMSQASLAAVIVCMYVYCMAEAARRVYRRID